MSERHPTTEPITSPQTEYDTLQHVSREIPCPYLTGHASRNEAYLVDLLDGATYERLMARGFRRSGRIIYRPRCRGCRECRQIRVRVDRFKRTRSMRRIWRRNLDVRLEHGDPAATVEKYALFERYLDAQHDALMNRSYDTFHEFLYDSPTPTCEFRYYLGERLIGVSILDVCPGGLSSLYMYFDPDHAARSLGTLSILREIEYCRERGFAYYYLGYYVAGSGKMAYKARFRPNEVLTGVDVWSSFRE